MPAEIPVTTPELLPIVAIEVPVEVQTPPGAPSARVIVLPTHTEDAPLIMPAEGTVFTVTSLTEVDVPQVLVIV